MLFKSNYFLRIKRIVPSRNFHSVELANGEHLQESSENVGSGSGTVLFK
jgi:hypothetical protein